MDRDDIEVEVAHEYSRASAKYGRLNHSNHESYGVLKEEVEEAEEAFTVVKGCLDDIWECCRDDKNENSVKQLIGYADSGEYWAIETIIELIQVAAMFEKAKKTAEEALSK